MSSINEAVRNKQLCKISFETEYWLNANPAQYAASLHFLCKIFATFGAMFGAFFPDILPDFPSFFFLRRIW